MWVLDAHAPIHASPFHRTTRHQLGILDFVEFVSQRLDALRVQCTSGETEVRQLDVPSAIHKEVLNRPKPYQRQHRHITMSVGPRVSNHDGCTPIYATR